MNWGLVAITLLAVTLGVLVWVTRPRGHVPPAVPPPPVDPPKSLEDYLNEKVK